MQSHMRTQVTGIGQIETDEMYVGVDHKGAHYVLPIQAKTRKDRMNVVQIEQDMTMCKEKFPSLICRPIGSQFTQSGSIVLFEFVLTEEGVMVAQEKHYRLVPPDQLSTAELHAYANAGG